MGVLTRGQQTEPKELTKLAVANRIRGMSANTFEQLAHTQKRGIDLVWHNPRGLTPQEVCDGLGTDAGSVFRLHSELTKTLVTVATLDGVDYTPALPTNAYQVNDDGTVTILDEPYTQG